MSQWGGTFEGCRLILPILTVDSLIYLLCFGGYLVLSLTEFRNFFKCKQVVRFCYVQSVFLRTWGLFFSSLEILQEVEVQEDQLK